MLLTGYLFCPIFCQESNPPEFSFLSAVLGVDVGTPLRLKSVIKPLAFFIINIFTVPM